MSFHSPPSLLTVGPIVIDVERCTTCVDGKPIALTPTEFGILRALATADRCVLTRSQLIEQAIGDGIVVTERTIDVHVTSLRGKLGVARNLIETVRGVGYLLRDS
jgi:two-component system phosphate regulon response regulator PhoB